MFGLSKLVHYAISHPSRSRTNPKFSLTKKYHHHRKFQNPTESFWTIWVIRECHFHQSILCFLRVSLILCHLLRITGSITYTWNILIKEIWKGYIRGLELIQFCVVQDGNIHKWRRHLCIKLINRSDNRWVSGQGYNKYAYYNE